MVDETQQEALTSEQPTERNITGFLLNASNFKQPKSRKKPHAGIFWAFLFGAAAFGGGAWCEWVMLSYFPRGGADHPVRIIILPDDHLGPAVPLEGFPMPRSLPFPQIPLPQERRPIEAPGA